MATMGFEKKQEVYASVPRALWAEIINLHGASRQQNKVFFQWPVEEPKLEVPTIYKAYIRPI